MTARLCGLKKSFIGHLIENNRAPLDQSEKEAMRNQPGSEVLKSLLNTYLGDVSIDANQTARWLQRVAEPVQIG
jgi:hypothetical protein